MNQSDLLDQFVIEARECLEAIGTRLLDVERDPGNLEVLNDLFRSCTHSRATVACSSSSRWSVWCTR